MDLQQKSDAANLYIIEKFKAQKQDVANAFNIADLKGQGFCDGTSLTKSFMKLNSSL
jgi:hypothetical protein